MVRGIRQNATIINPQVQPQAQYVYDPITRRAVRYVETVVPTIQASEANSTSWLTADRYYAMLGAPSGYTPAWATPASTSNWSFNTWDATAKRYYANGSTNAGVASMWCAGTNYQFFWPTGIGGETSSFTPKNMTTTTLHLYVTAKFYDSTGGSAETHMGLTSDPTNPPAAGDHFISIQSAFDAWRLGTGDGSTAGTTDGPAAGADTSWHEFHVTWTDGTVVLYVDDVSTATRTTLLPAVPLMFFVRSVNSTYPLQVAEVLISWT